MPNYFGIVNGRTHNEIAEEIVKFFKDNPLQILCTISYKRDRSSCEKIDCGDCALSAGSKTLEGEERRIQVKDFLKL